MGAVQRLATVVIIGLVALATVLTVYIADEPNRRGGEASEQDVVAIQRGTDLYIQYCLQCHGPSGLGLTEGNGRIGPALNQESIPEDQRVVTFQSDDPADQTAAEVFLHYRIENGAPSDPRLVKLMPAFGTELNVEEINDLVYMVMNVNWDYVYNESVIQTGQAQHDAVCLATPGLEGCGEEEAAIEPAYPTVPPPTAEADGEAIGDAATPVADGATPVATVDASDTNQWSVTEITARPGDTIQVNNVGVLAHDFTVDELGIADPLAGGAETTVTIPADAAPGTYTFYCSVPGHREQGMEGTLTIEAA